MNSRQFRKYANYVLNGIVEELEMNIGSVPKPEDFNDAIEIMTNLVVDAGIIEDDNIKSVYQLCKDELAEIKAIYLGLKETLGILKLKIIEVDDDDEQDELESQQEQAISDTCTMICDIMYDLVQAIDALGDKETITDKALAKFNALAQSKQSLQAGEKGEVSAG